MRLRIFRVGPVMIGRQLCVRVGHSGEWVLSVLFRKRLIIVRSAMHEGQVGVGGAKFSAEFNCCFKSFFFSFVLFRDFFETGEKKNIKKKNRTQLFQHTQKTIRPRIRFSIDRHIAHCAARPARVGTVSELSK